MAEPMDFEGLLERRLNARATVASRPFDAAAIAHSVVATGRREPARSPWRGRRCAAPSPASWSCCSW